MTKRSRYHNPPNIVIKLALIHAIDERESLMDAGVGHMESASCARQIADFKLMLLRRYGFDHDAWQKEAFGSGNAVNVFDLMTAPRRNFNLKGTT